MNAPDNPIKCSVVVPCRNEASFISHCLNSIFANDYPVEQYEVLIADGRSDDGTREILDRYSNRHGNMRVLDSPGKSAAAGLNTAIRNARGELVIRVDAHSTIETSYISRCVEYMEASGADNVGGIMHTHPMQQGAWSAAIVCALSHRFGVGNSTFRVHSLEPRWVDTVFGGCYRRALFQQIGYFNERLVRGQDMEFNQRLTRSGGRILLVPDIVSHYYARSELSSFCRHNWSNGVWAVMPFVHSDVIPVRLRHLIPLFFVSALLTAGIVSAFWTPARYLLLAGVGSYALASGIASIDAAVRHRDAQLLFLMPATFSLLHFTYGGGSLLACLRIAFRPKSWRRMLHSIKGTSC